jgi:Patatin phospholipase
VWRADFPSGILSNTPTEAIFDDYPRRDSLVFVVNVWNPTGREPKTIWDVLHRHKDIQYSSRVVSHIARQQQLPRLRHVISQLAAHITEPIRATPEVGNLLGYGCVTRMHFVPLLAPRLANEGHNKDIDFSAQASKPAASHVRRSPILCCRIRIELSETMRISFSFRAATHSAPQHHHLVPERRILGLKPALRLERRDQKCR